MGKMPEAQNFLIPPRKFILVTFHVCITQGQKDHMVILGKKELGGNKDRKDPVGLQDKMGPKVTKALWVPWDQKETRE